MAHVDAAAVAHEPVTLAALDRDHAEVDERPDQRIGDDALRDLVGMAVAEGLRRHGPEVVPVEPGQQVDAVEASLGAGPLDLLVEPVQAITGTGWLVEHGQDGDQEWDVA